MRHNHNQRTEQQKALALAKAETHNNYFVAGVILFLSVFIFSFIFAASANAALTKDQKNVLKSISKQMNGYKTMAGKFVQTGPNGNAVKGNFYMHRPGLMRFKYNKPATIDIIADGRSVAVINTKLETQDLLPLKKTPLRYLLRRKLNLNKVKGIKNVGLLGNSIVVIIEDPEAFNESQLRLFFTKDTYELEQWIVTDAQGLDTSVQIFDTEKGQKLKSSLFKIKYPGN
ncbi:MAG: outer-membrane lipoprotein carrier protein LolA [Hyphomicrobiales bacterium]